MQIRLINEPNIILHTTRNITNTIKAYVDNHHQEISWLGVVERLGEFEFKLVSVHLVKQQCSSITTEMDPTYLINLDKELRDTGVISENTQMDKGLYFWGHSHHTMGVGPSGQDNHQFEKLLQGSPFYFRQIVNKRGENNMSIILPDKNIVVDGLGFTYSNEHIDVESIKAEIAEKVKPFTNYQTGNQTNALLKNWITVRDTHDDGVPNISPVSTKRLFGETEQEYQDRLFDLHLESQSIEQAATLRESFNHINDDIYDVEDKISDLLAVGNDLK